MKQKEELMKIGNSNIVIMKGKENQSICYSLESFECPENFKLLEDNRETFILKRIIVLQCKETDEIKQIKHRKRRAQPARLSFCALGYNVDRQTLILVWRE